LNINCSTYTDEPRHDNHLLATAEERNYRDAVLFKNLGANRNVAVVIFKGKRYGLDPGQKFCEF
jgi:hypothetical protein